MFCISHGRGMVCNIAYDHTFKLSILSDQQTRIGKIHRRRSQGHRELVGPLLVRMLQAASTAAPPGATATPATSPTETVAGYPVCTAKTRFPSQYRQDIRIVGSLSIQETCVADSKVLLRMLLWCVVGVQIEVVAKIAILCRNAFQQGAADCRQLSWQRRRCTMRSASVPSSCTTTSTSAPGPGVPCWR